MNLAKILGVVLVLALLITPVIAANATLPGEETAEESCEKIRGMVKRVINLLTIIAAGIAVIMAIVVGIMFMQTSDPSEKERLGARLKQLIIGIIIVVIAGPLVNILFGTIVNCASVAP